MHPRKLLCPGRKRLRKRLRSLGCGLSHWQEESGRMPKPGPRLRLVDVAERAGVSLATASRALAGRDGVSQEVADRIRQISRELGYVANPYARTLAGGASSTVGLVVHQVDDPYF